MWVRQILWQSPGHAQCIPGHPHLLLMELCWRSYFCFQVVILGVTFASKMTFVKHIRSVSRACASQRLGILRKSWRVFHNRSLLDRCFRGFVLPVLEYCYAVWSSAADTYLKLQDRAVSGARFLTGVVFECDIAHRRSVAVPCLLYKIRCNPMHPLNGDLYLDRMCQCGLHVVFCSHIGILMRRLAAENRSTAWLLLPSRCLSGTILLTLYRLCGTGWFQEQDQWFFIGLICCIPPIYSFLLFFPFFIIIIIASNTGPSGKKWVYKLLSQTPRAHAPRKTEKQTQGSNPKLTDEYRVASLNPFNVLVSNTV